ncbi:hypothetical protein [Bacillus sp. 166amftsu]|nr:hypothetical protein [Bacillus sp. 166amftsu]
MERFAHPLKKEQHAFQVKVKRSDIQLEVPTCEVKVVEEQIGVG